MENKKNLTKSITVVAVVLSVVAVAMVGAASAKSLYVNKDIGTSQISAYDIQASPSYLVWQQTSAGTGYGGVGLTIDTDSEILFVTFEGSGSLAIVDAKTLNTLGSVSAPGADNLAGIVVDQDKQKVYTVDRNTDTLFVYTWNAASKTLTLDSTQTLPGIYYTGYHSDGLHGIALDEGNDLLYACDVTMTVKIFNTADWSSAGSITVSQKAMSVAVDEANGFIYTGNAYPPYGSIGILSKYDLNTNTESTVNIQTLSGGVTGDNVIGVAVDPATSLVYVTTGNQGSGGSDRILVFDSNLNLLHATGDIGAPTGICVPGKEISYNPLNLGKDDGISTCVNPSDTITYSICYDNTNNNYQVENVVITDTLPAEVSYVSSTGGGIYAAGPPETVTWNIGTLAAGASQQCVTMTVTVKSSTAPGSTITNSAMIDSDQTPPTTVNEQTEVCQPGEKGNCCACPAGTCDGCACTCMQAADEDDCVNNLKGIWVDTDGCDIGTNEPCDEYTCEGGECIPEFSTIALPVASILGLLFYFNYRKRKREQ